MNRFALLRRPTTKLLPIFQPRIHHHFHHKPQRTNSILKASSEANSISKKALLHPRQLCRKGVSSMGSYLLLHLLKQCTKKSCGREGRATHAITINLGFGRVIFLQTALINMYSMMGHLNDAHRMFDEIPYRNPNKVLKLFRQMQLENVEPNQVTVTVALSACADLGALDLCLNNAIINMYAKCGDVGTTRILFDSVRPKDVTTWTSMIVGHAVHEQAEEALRLFEEMNRSKSKRKMRNKNDGEHWSDLILPNEVTFIGVLMACSHKGLVEEEWQHLESMSKKYGLKPRISHYGCMVDLLCRAGLLKDAYDFIVNMPIQANAVVWCTLLGACSLHGDTELGLSVRQRLFELDPSHVGDDVALSNTYAAAGLWDDKIPGCSSIETTTGVHEFVTADRSHHMKREIYEVLEGMIKNLKASDYNPDTQNIRLNELEG
uniref:Pentatricopeptide repeat-containing protein At1g74400 n=1 Tax=Nelumbo nucifera TaxID=4432 RepID=A0A822XZK7_NELNU|nr:TPA_asm: hypothetical protein HUJ06_024281 [Nelumbo nucifera]